MQSIYVGEFSQRKRTFYGEKEGIRNGSVITLCESDGVLYVGCDDGLLYKKGEKFVSLELGKKSAVRMLFAKDGILYVGCDDTVYFIKSGKVTDSQCLEGTVMDADSDADGTLWLTTDTVFYKLCDGRFTRYSKAGESSVFAMTAFASGQVYLANSGFLYGLHGKRPRWSGICPLNSGMPDSEIRDLAADDWGHIWVATEDGVVLYDAKNNWYTSERAELLPRGDIRKIVITRDGTRYIGTDCGLIIQNGTKESFLGAERWLPDGQVTAISVTEDGTVYVATPKGISKIESLSMTLSQKAAIFEETVEKYHVREGYVTQRRLTEKNNMDSGSPCITDNDGLWTGFYLAAEALRYGTTGEEEALTRARRAKDALIKLIYVTEIPGFPARAYRRPGEDRFGDGNSEWHLVKDEKGELEWKGETSSDETVGHFFGLSFYYDLCADEAEKKEISDALCSIVDHIVRNGFTLCDADGLPTTWAHWGPAELNRDDIWFWEKGINSLELLCMLKTALHMSADEKYEKLYRELIEQEHYALNCIQVKVDDCYVNHIDDNLGFLTYANLLRYEKDPQLRQYFLMGMKHHWQIERIERCPMWNLIYAAMSDDISCDMEKAVESLCKMPLDLIDYKITNSGRKGLKWSSGQELFGGRKQLCEPLPYDEKPVCGYDNNPFYADDGNGMSAQEPSLFLTPYWYGRYYGLIKE